MDGIWSFRYNIEHDSNRNTFSYYGKYGDGFEMQADVVGVAAGELKVCKSAYSVFSGVCIVGL